MSEYTMYPDDTNNQDSAIAGNHTEYRGAGSEVGPTNGFDHHRSDANAGARNPERPQEQSFEDYSLNLKHQVATRSSGMSEMHAGAHLVSGVTQGQASQNPTSTYQTNLGLRAHDRTPSRYSNPQYYGSSSNLQNKRRCHEGPPVSHRIPAAGYGTHASIPQEPSQGTLTGVPVRGRNGPDFRQRLPYHPDIGASSAAGTGTNHHANYQSPSTTLLHDAGQGTNYQPIMTSTGIPAGPAYTQDTLRAQTSSGTFPRVLSGIARDTFRGAGAVQSLVQGTPSFPDAPQAPYEEAVDRNNGNKEKALGNADDIKALRAGMAHLAACLTQHAKSLDRNTQAIETGNPGPQRFVTALGPVPMERKPNVEVARVSSVSQLKCGASDCEESNDGPISACQVAQAWSVALINRLPELKVKSGSALGVHIAQKMDDPSVPLDIFFPSHEVTLREIFEPVVKTAAKLRSLQLLECHIAPFFTHNKETVLGEINKAIRNARNTRKSEIVKQFKHFATLHSTAGYMHLFNSKTAVDDGNYRRTAQSPIDFAPFVNTMKKVFKLKGKRTGLGQLAFASVSLIKAFANKRAGEQPTLFEIVPDGAGGGAKEEDIHEMMGLSMVCLMGQLDQLAEITTYGWKTRSLEVNDTARGNGAASSAFRRQLGTRTV